MSRTRSLFLIGLSLPLLACCNRARETDTNTQSGGTLELNRAIARASAAPKISATTSTSTPTITTNVDDVITRLDLWFSLIQPDISDTNVKAQAYADFLDMKPNWPARGLMMARYQTALATRVDDTELPQLCTREPLTNVQAFMRCAALLPNAASQARLIWRTAANRDSDANIILAEYSTILTPEDHWARFQHQIQSGLLSAANRQISLLPPNRQNIAHVLLSIRSRAPDADAQFDALPAAQRAEPIVLIARLKQLRLASRLDEAYALWQSLGLASQAKAPSTGWTNERLRLARALLLDGSIAQARILASDTTLPDRVPTAMEAHFLRGWIDLRLLQHPEKALEAFLQLSRQTSLIIRSRGFYWIARCYIQQGENEKASAAYRQAATMPTTYYGQLAQSALEGPNDTLLPNGGTIQNLSTALSRLAPLATGPLTRPDLVEAARLLHERGDDGHARQFLMFAYNQTQDPSEQAALARFALSIKAYEPAVFAARRTGRLGAALYPEGWPMLDSAEIKDDALPHGLTLAVSRQESSFNTSAISPARAIGLMQLQLATARDVARHAGLTDIDTSISGLKDPATNLTLGRAYLSQLMTRFDNVVPVVLSAYNAGPHRTTQWLSRLPLPQPLTQEGMVDWIESLPYGETRSYIQRVIENMMLYRVLETGTHGRSHP